MNSVHNAEKCEYLSHLKVDKGRKVQEREEKCETKKEKNQKDDKQCREM